MTLLCSPGVLTLRLKRKLEYHLELCHKSVQQPSPTDTTARRVCTHANPDDQDMQELGCVVFLQTIYSEKKESKKQEIQDAYACVG